MGNINAKLYEIRRRSCLKIFHVWSSDGPFVQQSITVCAILVEGIMRNTLVKLF